MKTDSKITSAEFLMAMVQLYAKRSPRRYADKQLKASIADCMKAKSTGISTGNRRAR